MMMFNSANLGALIVKKEAEVRSWEDNFYGIQSIGIDEEYGFGIINDGQAIGIARNVKTSPNEFVLPARTVFTDTRPGAGNTRFFSLHGLFATFVTHRRSTVFGAIKSNACNQLRQPGAGP